MEKITKWDYAMTGDEYELVSEWARNAYDSMDSFFMIIGVMKYMKMKIFKNLEPLEIEFLKIKLKQKVIGKKR